MLFNIKKEADELIVLDIDATTKGIDPDFLTIKKMAANVECPFMVEVKTVDHAEHIISLGVEKVAVSASFIANPELVTDISSKIGGQSVVVILDVREIYLENMGFYA